jgi:hypothetical protein
MKVHQTFINQGANLMTSVTQCEAMLNHVLNERANALARETGFVKRERKLTGARFVQVLAVGHLHQPAATLDQLTQDAQVCGVQISASGLHQRCTEQAASFLQAVLAELVEQVVTVQAAPVALFKRFEQVILEDASTIVLPAALAELWQGCGGGSANTTEHTASALKLHVRLDLKAGQLIGPYLSAGRVHELHGPLREQPLAAGSLYVADRGYWSLERLRHWSEQGVRFCQHPKANTVFYDRQGKRMALETALPRAIGQVKVLHVWLGKQEPLPVRLIMVRVPNAVAEQRRERLKQEAADKGQPVSEAQRHLAAWTLIVTNASAKQLGVEHALVRLARTLAHRAAFQTLEESWSHRCLALGFALAGLVRTVCEIDRRRHATLAPLVWMLARPLAQLVQSGCRGSRSRSGPLGGPLWHPSVASAHPQRASHDAIRLPRQSSSG